MGLDSFLYARFSATAKGGVAFHNPTPHHRNTWRKYQSLHDHIESLWISAGRPGSVVHESRSEAKVTADADGNGYTVVMPSVIPADAPPMFNQVQFAITSEQLEAFFRSADSAFDTPNSVKYDALTDADNELSEAEFYRNWNNTVLKLAKLCEAKGMKLYYNSWW